MWLASVARRTFARHKATRAWTRTARRPRRSTVLAAPAASCERILVRHYQGCAPRGKASFQWPRKRSGAFSCRGPCAGDQLFARKSHKNTLQKYFLWSNRKKIVKTGKKLAQILKILMKNLISNLTQIWIWKNFKFKPNSFEFEFEKVFKLDSNLNPIWIQFSTRSFCYFAKFEWFQTWQVYNTK